MKNLLNPDEKPSESRLSTLSIQYSSGTDVVLLKTESKERGYVDTVNTNTSVNKHSIKCIACFDLHIDSINKHDPTQNTIALL